MTWADLWQRQDQRAPELIRNDPKQAAARLDDPEWKGSALYRSGQFDAAAQVFSRAEGPRASYNQGNALARAGKLEEALAAYNHALAESPDMEDARHNLKIVEELLKQKNQGNGDSQSNKQKDPSESPGSDGNKPQDNQGQPGNSKNPGDSGNEQQQNSGNSQEPGEPNRKPDKQTNEPKGQTPEQASAEQASSANQPQAPAPISETPLTQSQEQSLRRIPDNPGGLLQRKFLQQYQQRQTPSDEGDTPW